MPLLLAEEGSQITTFGGRRVTNFTFLTQNFWREKGLKSQKICGRRGSNEGFTPPPPKSCRLIFKIKGEGPEENQNFDLNKFAPDKRFLVRNWTKNKNKWLNGSRNPKNFFLPENCTYFGRFKVPDKLNPPLKKLKVLVLSNYSAIKLANWTQSIENDPSKAHRRFVERIKSPVRYNRARTAIKKKRLSADETSDMIDK